MTTPKELADKAKQQADVRQEAWHDYMNALRIDVHGEIVSASTAHLKAHNDLRATIDQLQAMAEARQGSGEPVALVAMRAKWNDDGTIETEYKHTSKGTTAPPHQWTLYTAPPSAQQATGSGQVLTDERIDSIWFAFNDATQVAHRPFARAILAAATKTK